MTNLENIKNIKSVVQNDQITQKKVLKEKKSDESFGNMVHDYLLKVSSDQKNAAEETKKVLADKSENVHDAMVALEEAGLRTIQSGFDNPRNVTGNPLAGIDPNEIIAEINSVSKDSVDRIANYILSKPITISSIGPIKNLETLEKIQSHLN